MTIVVYPFGPDIHLPFNLPLIGNTIPMVVTRFDVALLYVLGVTSVGVYGIALAGWSSNNKYSLMGGLRSSAQMISYELALGLGLIGVILQSGTLDLYTIVEQQALFGVLYFLGKVILFLVLFIWLRGTLPRFRFDQLMSFGWKFLVPAALINIVVTATIEWSGLFDWMVDLFHLKTQTGWWG